MAFELGYCDLSYANGVNLTDEWSYAETPQKEFSLSIAKKYIDSKYNCGNSYYDSSSSYYWDTTDYNTIPEEVKWSNAYFAEQYILGNLTATNTNTVSGPVTKKKVKADSVEVETTYAGYFNASSRIKDMFPDATIMLSKYCTLGNSNKTLTRV